MTGTILKLKGEGGYGFISSPDLDSNVFFHVSSLRNRRFEELIVGHLVEFTVERTPKGLRALDVNAQ